MSIKALSDYTFYAKYAKYVPEKKRRETWSETVERVFGMHEEKFGDILAANQEFRKDFDFAKEQVLKKRVLGAQRALQFGGPAILKKNEKIYNCAVTYLDRARAFQEIMFLLLCGCGVGFSVQKQHINKLPKIKARTNGTKTFVIPDTIEGWSDAIGVLMDSYFQKTTQFGEYHGYKVEFDASQIRAEGAPISGGFKAPGPNGLMKALGKIEALVEARLARDENRLHAIDGYDIIMHSSDAVLSGGVRRSATICIFSKDDEEMITAKTGDWFIKNPQRGRSNNSALLVRGETSKEEFAKLMQSVRQFGEPGFVWAESDDVVYNPCFEKNTFILTDKGYKKIIDLYDEQTEFNTVVDNRVGKDSVNLTNKGTSVKSCTKVALTQENADIYEVKTEHGITIKTTSNHTFATTEGKKQLKDIEIGEKLLLQSDKGKFGDVGDYKTGVLLGMLVGDGTIARDRKQLTPRIVLWGQDLNDANIIQQYHDDVLQTAKLDGEYKFKQGIQGNVNFASLTSPALGAYFESLGINLALVKEEVPQAVLQGTEEMVKGYIHGLFYADGSVPMYEKAKDSISSIAMFLPSTKSKLLQQIQMLLLNFGIVSRQYQLGNDEDYNADGKRALQLPNGKGGYSEYMCNRQYELIINRPNMVKFEEMLGLFGRKANSLKTILDTRGRECYKPERHISKIVSIKYLKTEDVYCFTETETNSTIANGLAIGQCVEIGMVPQTEDGKSGVQFCNLCEINAKKIKSVEDFLQVARAAAIIGTMQAAYTDFPYLGKVTEEIVCREALLGVSMTGMMDSPDVIFNEENQQAAAKEVKKTNEKVAKWLGINPAARTTCVKPAGSTSCILGSASGVHPHHAKRYFRRVQANKLEFPLQYFAGVNPLAVEKSVWSANGTDYVITFLCDVPQGAIIKNQLSAVELLERVKLTQQNWVEHGTTPKRGIRPYVRHNVSNTITVKDEEWDAIEKYIYDNRDWFAGISLLPFSGDKDYPQAPFCAVYTPKELVEMYGDASVFASGLIVDGLKAFDNNLWAACDVVNGIGEVVEPMTEPQQPEEPKKNGYSDKEYVKKLKSYTTEYYMYLEEYEKYQLVHDKLDWVRRANQFADRYFAGNKRKMTYCLKDVANWKTWCDLKREYKEIDWAEVVEDNETVVDIGTMGAIACSGGKCEIV